MAPFLSSAVVTRLSRRATEASSAHRYSLARTQRARNGVSAARYARARARRKPHCGQSPHPPLPRGEPLNPLCSRSPPPESLSSAVFSPTTATPVVLLPTQRTRRDLLLLSPKRLCRLSPEPSRSSWRWLWTRVPLRRPQQPQGQLKLHRRRAPLRLGRRPPPYQRLRRPGQRPSHCPRAHSWPGSRPPLPPPRPRAHSWPDSRPRRRRRQLQRTGRLRRPHRRRAASVPQPTPRRTLALRSGLPQPALFVCRVRRICRASKRFRATPASLATSGVRRRCRLWFLA